MKIQFLIFCFSTMFFAACNLNNSHAFLDNFPGLYVRQSAHEFGKENDTLVITKLETGRFQVLRKWNYERVLDGRIQTPDYKQEITGAVWDEKHKRIVNPENWQFLDLYAEKGVLFVGNTEYKKLK